MLRLSLINGESKDLAVVGVDNRLWKITTEERTRRGRVVGTAG